MKTQTKENCCQIQDIQSNWNLLDEKLYFGFGEFKGNSLQPITGTQAKCYCANKQLACLNGTLKERKKMYAFLLFKKLTSNFAACQHLLSVCKCGAAKDYEFRMGSSSACSIFCRIIIFTLSFASLLALSVVPTSSHEKLHESNKNKNHSFMMKCPVQIKGYKWHFDD